MISRVVQDDYPSNPASSPTASRPRLKRLNHSSVLARLISWSSKTCYNIHPVGGQKDLDRRFWNGTKMVLQIWLIDRSDLSLHLDVFDRGTAEDEIWCFRCDLGTKHQSTLWKIEKSPRRRWRSRPHLFFSITRALFTLSLLKKKTKVWPSTFSARFGTLWLLTFPKIRTAINGRRFSYLSDIQSREARKLNSIPEKEFQVCFAYVATNYKIFVEYNL